ncbi:hypothetical protein [Streptomyces sp. NPDC085659]|uniref:hypothetical protein n=1 Tax=Streptomyces sp. NPDC085659 TaxID=3155177 RepID=UPI00344BD5CC
MRTSTRALAVSTASSLIAVIAVTIAAGARWWLWAAWVVLALITTPFVAAERYNR